MKHLRAYLDLSAAMAIVGSSVVVGKMITAHFPVFLAGTLRFTVASVILLPLLSVREQSARRGILRKDWKILFLQAFCGVFLFTIFLLFGLRLTSAAEAGIITSASPAVLGLISIIWLKERVTRSVYAGIGLTVCGILLVNVLGSVANAERGVMPLAGNLLIFGAVVGEALFSIFGKMLNKMISPLCIATWMSVFGLLLFLPLGLYEAVQFDFSTLRLADWLTIVYSGVIVTVVAFLFWFSGLAQVEASRAAVFTGVMPLSALTLSALLLREPISYAHLLGCLCVLLGIGLITRTTPQTRSETACVVLPAEQ
ncbi:BH0390 protein [Candidatus Moduliflexus flocculans]|uniref:BH0390 protein n=1 Tax=Candidatus Moduliflexus flocculans TaxID=1499966 RepID=A0A081BPZ3_9BACT|nr:BH0390 protein [Candidatus Moduliflexus flocculans]